MAMGYPAAVNRSVLATLPRRDRRPDSAAVQRSEREGTWDLMTRASASEPKHIYVINDEASLLSLLRDLLEDEGYRATLETFDPSGIEGQLARIREVKPDLVVLDFLIGGELLGWQFLQCLRLQRDTAKLPVVVCTAAANTVKELGTHLTEQCVGVVLKPFNIDDLLAEITRGLEASIDDPWMLAKPS